MRVCLQLYMANAERRKRLLEEKRKKEADQKLDRWTREYRIWRAGGKVKKRDMNDAAAHAALIEKVAAKDGAASRYSLGGSDRFSDASSFASVDSARDPLSRRSAPGPTAASRPSAFPARDSGSGKPAGGGAS